VISFDDGMKDIVTVVLPIMKKLGLKFNINIYTEILETNKPQRFIQVYDILNYGRKKDSYFYALFMNSPITINYSAPHLTEAEFTKLLSNLSVEQKDSLIQNMIETFEFNTSNFTKVISIHDLIDLGKEKLVEIGSHSHTHPDFSTLHEQELIYEMKHSKNTLEKLIQKKVDIIAYPNGITSESIDLHAKRCGYRILLKTNDQINTINNNTTSFYRIHEYHNNVELLLAHSYGILNKLKKVLR
jgi:peptidoglycan/xylan/chitin deacetylase (PgdA/CDA1 family)